MHRPLKRRFRIKKEIQHDEPCIVIVRAEEARPRRTKARGWDTFNS